MTRRVAVLGGGVAGLTTADELSRRGYAVDLYEREPVVGGRARYAAFVAGFSRNLMETMAGIPVSGASGGGDSVADLLTTATHLTVSHGAGLRSIRWADVAAIKPGRLHDAADLLLNGGTAPRGNGFGPRDVAYVAHLLGVAAFADRHKLAELEGHTFVDYACTVFAERSVLRPSPRLTDFLSGIVPHLLLPGPVQDLSARTALVTLLRLLNPRELYTDRGDRLLPETATRSWLDRWSDDLVSASAHRPQAVRFHGRCAVVGVELHGARSDAFVLESGARVTDFDHVVCALPPGSALAAIGSPLPEPLAGMPHLSAGRVVGVQYVLASPSPLAGGRAVHVDGGSSLTSVHRGDVVDVMLGETAIGDRADGDILDEVWRRAADAGLVPADGDGDAVVERRILGDAAGFVSTAGSWAHRPVADIGFDNLFLAGEHVRTNADLSTLEAANESARRAVQALLDRDGFTGSPVKISTIDHLGLLEDT